MVCSLIFLDLPSLPPSPPQPSSTSSRATQMRKMRANVQRPLCSTYTVCGSCLSVRSALYSKSSSFGGLIINGTFAIPFPSPTAGTSHTAPGWCTLQVIWSLSAGTPSPDGSPLAITWPMGIYLPLAFQMADRKAPCYPSCPLPLTLTPSFSWPPALRIPREPGTSLHSPKL